MVGPVDSRITYRVEAVRQLLHGYDMDMLIVAPSADLRYLIGHSGHASERVTLLLIGQAEQALLLVPGFETSLFPRSDTIRTIAYDDHEDPYELLLDELQSREALHRIGISDQTWSCVLLHLQQALPRASFVSGSSLLRHLRMRKSAEEVDLLRRAGHLVDTVFEQILQSPFAGQTENTIASQLNDLICGAGLQRAEWGPIVGSGPNSASPHHVAGDREIREGDAIVLDFGGVLDGYQADISRTIHVGTPSSEFRRAYEVVQAAQHAGIQAVQPGISAESVDAATRSVIETAGYGEYFIHRTGHGLGLDAHEDPYIVKGNSLDLQTGMVFSIEPGVYLPDRFGIRIEDIVAVTETGAIRLNEAPKHLIVLH